MDEVAEQSLWSRALFCRLGFLQSVVSREERGWLCPGRSHSRCHGTVLPHHSAGCTGGINTWLEGTAHTGGHFIQGWARTTRKTIEQSWVEPTSFPWAGLSGRIQVSHTLQMRQHEQWCLWLVGTTSQKPLDKGRNPVNAESTFALHNLQSILWVRFLLWERTRITQGQIAALSLNKPVFFFFYWVCYSVHFCPPTKKNKRPKSTK